MNHATVPANVTTLARTSTGAHTSTPPTRSLKGRPFSEVHEAVMARADDMLADRVVHIADLKMNPAGHLVVPGGTELRLNPWARKGLASMLGLRWDTWFKSASGDERAEEINRRFSRIPGEKKIRAWRDHDGVADGIARCFLPPGMTAIDDARIFDRMHAMLRGQLDSYLFTAVEFTNSTTHYTAVHTEPFNIDGDLLHPGFHIRNSEVGGAPLSLDDHWWRQVCTNGLMVRIGGKRSLYRIHRAIENEALDGGLVVAIARLPQRWQTSFAWMQAAKRVEVQHPDDEVAAILGDSPKALLKEAQRVVLRDGDYSRFGVVQAVTYVAHVANTDPNVRFQMETLAGQYLAGTAGVAAT